MILFPWNTWLQKKLYSFLIKIQNSVLKLGNNVLEAWNSLYNSEVFNLPISFNLEWCTLTYTCTEFWNLSNANDIASFIFDRQRGYWGVCRAEMFRPFPIYEGRKQICDFLIFIFVFLRHRMMIYNSRTKI